MIYITIIIFNCHQYYERIYSSLLSEHIGTEGIRIIGKRVRSCSSGVCSMRKFQSATVVYIYIIIMGSAKASSKQKPH